jgi:hypothetical protein
MTSSPLTSSTLLIPGNNTKDNIISANFHPQTSFANVYSWTRYNNIRCFPTCDVVHRPHHFCGRYIMINVSRRLTTKTTTTTQPPPVNNNMYIFGEFRQAKSPQRYEVGSSWNLHKNVTISASNTNNESPDDTPNHTTINENTNHFPASLVDDETTDTNMTFVIYPPRKWKNDVLFSPKMETICLFAVYVIHTQLEMCVAVVNSTPFKLGRSKSASLSGVTTTTTTTSLPSITISQHEDDEDEISSPSSKNNKTTTKSLSTSSPLQTKRMKKIAETDSSSSTTLPSLATNNNVIPATLLVSPPLRCAASSSNRSSNTGPTLLLPPLPPPQQSTVFPWNNHPSINSDIVHLQPSQYFPFRHSFPLPFFTNSAWFPSIQQHHLLLPPTIILPPLLSNHRSILPTLPPQLPNISPSATTWLPLPTMVNRGTSMQ